MCYTIAVPATNCNTDSNPQLYTIKLQGGTMTTIPGSILAQFIEKTNDTFKLHFPDGYKTTNKFVIQMVMEPLEQVPTSLQKALHLSNTDAHIWNQSYKKEYDAI